MINRFPKYQKTPLSFPPQKSTIVKHSNQMSIGKFHKLSEEEAERKKLYRANSRQSI
jgi:hypothetical protein